MKFTLDIVALPLLPLLLATMALTAPIGEVAVSDRAFSDSAINARAVS